MTTIMVELTVPDNLWEKKARWHYIMLEAAIEALLELLNLPAFVQIHFKSFLEMTEK